MEEEHVVYVGLDIETTGLDVNRHGILQLGIYGGDSIWSVSQDVLCHGVEWDAEAEAVHGISESTAVRYFPSADMADENTVFWLSEAIAKKFPDHAEKKVVLYPVGFNVTAFDMPFVRKFLPGTASLFHPYRGVDLNSVIMAYSEQRGESFKDLKARFNAEGEESMPEAFEPHEAFSDAMHAWHVWKALTR